MAPKEGVEEKKKVGRTKVNRANEGVQSSRDAFNPPDAPEKDCWMPQKNNLLGKKGAQQVQIESVGYLEELIKTTQILKDSPESKGYNCIVHQRMSRTGTCPRYNPTFEVKAWDKNECLPP
jgi:hypothetical protein